MKYLIHLFICSAVAREKTSEFVNNNIDQYITVQDLSAFCIFYDLEFFRQVETIILGPKLVQLQF